jgi:hypothetical protein
MAGASDEGRRDAVLQLVHAEALFFQLDEAKATLLVAGAGLRGLLQLMLWLTWFHDRNSFRGGDRFKPIGRFLYRDGPEEDPEPAAQNRESSAAVWVDGSAGAREGVSLGKRSLISSTAGF